MDLLIECCVNVVKALLIANHPQFLIYKSKLMIITKKVLKIIKKNAKAL